MGSMIYRNNIIQLYKETVDKSVESGYKAIALPVLIEEIFKVPNSKIKKYLIREKGDEGIVLEALQSVISAKIAEDLKYRGDSRKRKDENQTNQEIKKGLLKRKIYPISFKYENQIGVAYAYVEANKIMSKAEKYAKKVKSEAVSVEHLIYALVESMPEELEMILFKLDIDLNEIKDEFSLENYKKYHIIPEGLENCLTILNEKYRKGDASNILSRERETEKMWDILGKYKKGNVILVGEAGVGKTAVVEELTNQIVNGKCPAKFKDCVVVMLNVNGLISGTKYRGQAEERTENLMKFLQSTPNVILFIDEIQTIIGAGSGSVNGGLDVANALKPLLASEGTKVIGATTKDEYQMYFRREEALNRRFENVNVREPNLEETFKMVQGKVKSLQKYHGVKISQNLLRYIIIIASCFKNELKNPDRTIDVVDRVAVHAKLKNKKKVTEDMVLDVFNANIEQYRKLPEIEKLAIAYHNAAHYLFLKKSNRLINYKRVAVSVIPTSEEKGLNVVEINETVCVVPDRNYYLELMAYNLVGGIAERKRTRQDSESYSKDLMKAKEIAGQLVEECALSDDPDYRYRVYIERGDNGENTPKTKLFIENAKNSAMAQADEIAKKFVERNILLITAIAEELIKKEMMTDEELCKFCDDFEEEKRQLT